MCTVGSHSLEAESQFTLNQHKGQRSPESAVRSHLLVQTSLTEMPPHSGTICPPCSLEFPSNLLYNRTKGLLQEAPGWLDPNASPKNNSPPRRGNRSGAPHPRHRRRAPRRPRLRRGILPNKPIFHGRWLQSRRRHTRHTDLTGLELPEDKD